MITTKTTLSSQTHHYSYQLHLRVNFPKLLSGFFCNKAKSIGYTLHYILVALNFARAETALTGIQMNVKSSRTMSRPSWKTKTLSNWQPLCLKLPLLSSEASLGTCPWNHRRISLSPAPHQAKHFQPQPQTPINSYLPRSHKLRTQHRT